MPINLRFTILDEDIERFRARALAVGESLNKEEDYQRIEDRAAELIREARKERLPQFIEERLLKLEILLNMVSDADWKLDDKERKTILGSLAYFVADKDMIEDSVPGLGFLDDALFTELILKELSEEIHAYNEFCQFRLAEQNRRRNRGLDPHVDREDWLADRRVVLHDRIRNRRQQRAGAGRGWHLGLFS